MKYVVIMYIEVLSSPWEPKMKERKEKQEKEKKWKARVVSTSFESLVFQKQSKVAKRAKEKLYPRTPNVQWLEVMICTNE